MNQKRAERIARTMEQTSSKRVRNAAAIALADMRYEPAGERIRRLLERPGIGMEAGTLLYALQELDSKVPLTILVNLLADASYEAWQEILILIEAGNIEPGSPDDRRAALEKLTSMARSTDGELAEVADAALQFLTAMHTSCDASL